MLELYAFATSNAQRVLIMLEECGLPYRLHRVDLTKGEQRKPEFLALNPLGAIPVLRDPDAPGGALTLSQSGAIMLWLAEKTGRFLPAAGEPRAMALQWFAFAISDCMAATGSIFFSTTLLPDKSDANLAWHEARLTNYFAATDARLAGREWLAGEVSIADFALLPIALVRRSLIDRHGAMPNLTAWMERLAARPGVARALATEL
jgi:GST-like protein